MATYAIYFVDKNVRSIAYVIKNKKYNVSVIADEASGEYILWHM
jgi:hypothetical protein